MEIPLVSISCITFNHASFIRESLEGFLSQKVNFPLEIVIYDDHSTDGTSEILREYEGRYPELIFLRVAEQNQYSKGLRGIAYRFNFPRCRGKYIALCEGDDYWNDPLKLQKQVDFLESNRNYTACVHSARVWDDTRQLFIPSIYDKISSDFNLSLNNVFSGSGGVYPTCSLLMRKDKVIYPENLLYFTGGDLILIIFMVTQGGVRFMSEAMGVYRVHSRGVYQGEAKTLDFHLENRRTLASFYLALNQHLETKDKGRLLFFRIKNKLLIMYLKLKISISEL